jgi:glycosyltransferase involved in cell wall biosynthesis
VNALPIVRVLAMMEAASVTGPAKNLLGYCRWLRTAEGEGARIRISLATFDRNSRTDALDGFVSAARAAGVETHVIHEKYRFDPGVMGQLRKIVDREQPDILQTHNNKSHLLIRAAPGLRARRIWFGFHHGDVYTDLKQRLYNQVDRVTLPAADRVITVCRAFAPRLSSFGVSSERIRILHNAADAAPSVSVGERAELRQQLGIGAGEALILSIGRLSHEKGHADVLRALGRYTSSPRGWKLVLCGAGPDREALERLARSLRIAEHVIFTGFRADAVRLFSIADLFVLASHTEGSSNVLLEAMASKVPIVATRAGGTPEIVVDGSTGLLVPVRDSRALGTAIARLLSDPKLAEGFVESAAMRAAHEFSPDRYRQRLCAIYSEGRAMRAATG